MKLSTTLGRLLLAILFVAAAGVQGVQAQPADPVFKRLKAKYDAIGSLRAEFEQTMTSEFSDDAATSIGLLILQNDKYRVETKGQTFVTDGAVTWVYLPAENQVLINDYVEDETTFSISQFFQTYDERYDVSKTTTTQLDGKKHYVLTLTPKDKGSFFKEVTLWMRDADSVITRLQVKDVNGTTMLFNLKNIQLNPTLNQSTFTFQPPKNAEVIDLRS